MGADVSVRPPPPPGANVPEETSRRTDRQEPDENLEPRPHVDPLFSRHCALDQPEGRGRRKYCVGCCRGHAACDGDGRGDDDGTVHEAARAKLILQRRIRRSASTEDVVPSGHRLTMSRLRALGSPPPEKFILPTSVFSPVKSSAKEPVNSPVARERAGELGKERPVTSKFVNQLSGGGYGRTRERGRAVQWAGCWKKKHLAHLATVHLPKPLDVKPKGLEGRLVSCP